MNDQSQVTVDDAVAAINEHMERTRSQWTPVVPDTQLDDLDLDSFEVTNILLSLEEKKGCRLNLDSIADAVFVRDLVALGGLADKRQQFAEEARQLIAAKSNTDPTRVEMTSRLTDDLGLDSIDIAELGEEWEERYDIDFDVDDVLNVMTVWDVVETVTTKMGSADAGDHESNGG